MQQSRFSYQKSLTNEKTKRHLENKNYGKNICVIFPVLIWLAGLVLAGSEGPLMPWLNIAGAIVFFGASAWLGKVLPCLEPDVKVEPDVIVKKNPEENVRHQVLTTGRARSEIRLLFKFKADENFNKVKKAFAHNWG